MKKSKRKEREVALARRAILESAARAFSRHGFQGATIEEIARDAGYSASSLYTYFKGKDEIYESLHTEVGAEFEAVKQGPSVPGLAFAERLEWLIRHLFEIVEKNHDFFLLFAAEGGGGKGPQRSGAGDRADATYLNWIEFMAGFLEQGGKEGAVKSGDFRDLAYFVVGTMNATIFRWVAGDLPMGLQAHASTLLEFVLAGLRPPLAQGENT